MFRWRLPAPSMAGNPRTLSWYLWWFCLRFYAATKVVYFAHVTGSLFLASCLMVMSQGTQALFEVPTGIWSDRLGRVLCLRLQAIAGFASVACYAVGGSYAWLVAGALFDGLWRSLMSGNDEAMLYESVRQMGETTRFPQYLARMNMAMELSGFSAMVVGGFLAAAGFGWALWLSAIMNIPALVISWRLVEPRRHKAPAAKSTWSHFREAAGYMRRHPVLRQLALAQIISEGCSTFALWPAFYATLMPLWLVGGMYSVNYIESALGFRASGWFLKRWRPMQVVFGGEVLARAMFLPALIWPGPWTPAVMAAAGAPYGPMTVALGTALHNHYTDHQRATMASIISLASNAVYAVFTLGIGLAADHFGAGRAILLGQVCLLPVLWLYWRAGQDVTDQ